MSGPYLAAALLWLVIFVYALAGSVDFGATFWRMVFARRSPEAERVAAHYVSPLWEATNVFLVLVAVGLVGFFPNAAFAYGSVLLVPGALILVLLAVRGAFLSFAYAGGRLGPALRVISGVTALVLPALMVSVLPISQGGFVRDTGGGFALRMGALLRSPTEYAYLAFGLAAGLFISATFLADYARTAGSEPAYRAFRTQALWSGLLMVFAGVAALFIIPSAVWLQDRLRQQWPWFLASLGAFGGGISAFWWPHPRAPSVGRPRFAVLLIGLQLALADVGYGIAHETYLLYPEVTTVAGFSGTAMFGAILKVLVIGMAVVVPGFIWLWRLFVLDPRYTRP